MRVGLQLGWRLEAGRQVIRGVLDFAERHGAWDMRWDMMFDPRFVSFNRLDGLIALPREPDLPRLRRLRLPLVLTSGSPLRHRVPTVESDDYAIGRMAAEHFLGLGFSTLGYFSHFPPQPDRRERGFLAAAAEASVSVHVLRTDEPSNALGLARRNPGLPRWLRSLPKPVGVFGFNDLDAVEIAQAARRVGILIPEEVALLGVDNDTILHRVCSPSLSSIDHGAYHIGYRAAQVMHDILSGLPAPTEPVLVPPVGVISRRSTDTLAIGDPDVALALRIIHDKACEGLSAASVLRRIHLSRTTLENRFRQSLGRSIHQEIVRVRIEEAKHLLRMTDLPMPDITHRAGFSYPSQVSHLFRRHVGMSPREYRASMRTVT